MAIAVMDSAVVAILVSVMVLTELTPRATSPNDRLAGANLTVVPVPLSGTCCGLPLPLSVMLMTAARAPVAAGVKSTLMVQAPLTAREAPQVGAGWMNLVVLGPVIAMLEVASEAVR